MRPVGLAERSPLRLVKPAVSVKYPLRASLRVRLSASLDAVPRAMLQNISLRGQKRHLFNSVSD